MQHASESSSNTVQQAPNVSNGPRKGAIKNKKIPKKLKHIPYPCLDNIFPRLRPENPVKRKRSRKGREEHSTEPPSPAAGTEGNSASTFPDTPTVDFEPGLRNAGEGLQGVVVRQDSQDSSLAWSYDTEYPLPYPYNAEHLLSSHCDVDYSSSSHYDEQYSFSLPQPLQFYFDYLPAPALAGASPPSYDSSLANAFGPPGLFPQNQDSEHSTGG